MNKYTNIDGVLYYARALKEGNFFNPIVSNTGIWVPEHFIENPQPTRSKALTIARRYIKNLRDNKNS